MLTNQFLQNTKWRWVIGIVLATLLLVTPACSKKDNQSQATPTPSSGDPNEIIATYKDNGKVTRGEFEAFLNVNKMFNPQMAAYLEDPTVKKEFFNQYLTSLILTEKASDKVKEEAEKKAADQVKQILEYFDGQEGGREKIFTDNKITEADLAHAIKISIYGLLSLQELVTEQEISDEYTRKQAAGELDYATVSHILIGLKDNSTGKELRTDEEALKRANEVIAKLESGGDFAALAKEYSDDPGSKDQGGTYKDALVYQWVEPFKKAALELPLNTISKPPVKTDYGYHVMKVESRGVKKLEDVKDEIQNGLVNKKYSEFMKNELPNYILTNTLDVPTPTPTTTPSATPTATPSQ